MVNEVVDYRHPVKHFFPTKVTAFEMTFVNDSFAGFIHFNKVLGTS